MTERMTGTVRWFDGSKGYGFIQPEASETDEEVFVHYSAIVDGGFRNLKEGEEVEFTVGEGPRGLQATQVVRL